MAYEDLLSPYTGKSEHKYLILFEFGVWEFLWFSDIAPRIENDAEKKNVDLIKKCSIHNLDGALFAQYSEACVVNKK